MGECEIAKEEGAPIHPLMARAPLHSIILSMLRRSANAGKTFAREHLFLNINPLIMYDVLLTRSIYWVLCGAAHELRLMWCGFDCVFTGKISMENICKSLSVDTARIYLHIIESAGLLYGIFSPLPNCHPLTDFIIYIYIHVSKHGIYV